MGQRNPASGSDCVGLDLDDLKRKGGHNWAVGVIGPGLVWPDCGPVKAIVHGAGEQASVEEFSIRHYSEPGTGPQK